jgi:anti-sigma B factor antagonist
LGQGIELKTEHVGETVVVHVAGELDLATAPSLDAAVSEALEMGQHSLVVDLLGVTFMDSSGLGSLVSVKEGEPSIDMTLVIGGGIVQKLIDITGLSGLFRIEDSVERALVRPGTQPSSST